MLIRCHILDLVLLPPRLDLVYALVAVVPGVQLLVLRVVVEAGVAGVALGEEQHGTLLAANGAAHSINTLSISTW